MQWHIVHVDMPVNLGDTLHNCIYKLFEDAEFLKPPGGQNRKMKPLRFKIKNNSSAQKVNW